MSKTKGFENFIFKSYGQDKNYDMIKQNMLNARQTMIDRHKCFARMSLKRQFLYCETICVIAVQTVTQHINQNLPLTFPEDKRFEYSINRDLKDVKYIELSQSIINDTLLIKNNV